MKIRDLIEKLEAMPDKDTEIVVGRYDAHRGRYESLQSPSFDFVSTIFVEETRKGEFRDVTDREREFDREAIVFTPR